MRILIVINAHLGDNVCSEPALREIIRKYPGAEIDVATKYPKIWEQYPGINIINFHDRRIKPYDLRIKRERIRGPHLVDHLALGGEVTLTDRIPHLSLSEDEKIYTAGIDFDKPTIILHLEPKRATKKWKRKYWDQLCERLYPYYQLIQIGTKGGTCGPVHYNLVGKTTLRQAMSLISKSRLVVAVDSGMAHVASALGVKNIVLFGPVDPKSCSHEGLTYPIEAHACIHCREKGKLVNRCPFGHKDCMRKIKPYMVESEVHRVLAIQ